MTARPILALLASAWAAGLPLGSAEVLEQEKSATPRELHVPVGAAELYSREVGRGRSAEHVQPENVSLASDIADLEKVRQYFHLDSVVLLGHSWGTVLALEDAVRYPERVSGLILMNPAPASADDYKELKKNG
jgi:pimeloyl-ACP methyl ester carboxylesterase